MVKDIYMFKFMILQIEHYLPKLNNINSKEVILMEEKQEMDMFIWLELYVLDLLLLLGMILDKEKLIFPILLLLFMSKIIDSLFLSMLLLLI